MLESRWTGVLLCAVVFGAGAAIRLERARVSELPVIATPATPRDLHFTDVAARMGIQFVYRDPRLNPVFQGKERLFFWGSGAAVADVNNDGWMDLLLPAARKGDRNHLYLNDRGVTFHEAAADWGIADNDEHAAVTSAVFFDYDNDGAPDLYLAGMGCSRVFHNTGRRFEDVSRSSGLRDCANAVTALPLDYDTDGLVDLYVLRYWPSTDYMNPADSRIWPENHFNAKNGGTNTLYRNQGGGRFADVTPTAGGGDTHWSLDAAWGHFTATGVPDLYIANDFGADVLFSSDGKTLVDRSARLATPDRRFGMGASLGDLDGDGRPHLFVTNEYVAGYNPTGNFLRKFDRDGTLHDEASSRAVGECGWAWGSLFADFDLDGREDLYVANGFITGQPGVADQINAYYGALRSDYAFTAATMMAAPGLLAIEFKNWPPIGTFSYAGHQVDCLFMNRGDRFQEWGRRAGITETSDGRAVVALDYDNNGAVDIVVTTQNGPPLLLRNGLDPRGRFIGFTLVGAGGNRDAVGARVEILQDGHRAYRWATGGHTGFLASSDPRLHFGLAGDSPVAARIRWPSGAEQVVPDLAPGRYYRIEEGSAR